MEKLPIEELQQRLAAAAKEVVIGGIYAHYKDPSKTYRIKELVIIEATNQVGVVYEAEYAKGVTFMRPLTSWLDKIDWRGRIVSRFTFIEK